MAVPPDAPPRGGPVGLRVRVRVPECLYLCRSVFQRLRVQQGLGAGVWGVQGAVQGGSFCAFTTCDICLALIKTERLLNFSTVGWVGHPGKALL